MKKLLFVVLFILFISSLQAAENRFYGKVIGKGNNTEKLIALTFDDGPNKLYTPQILDILKKYNIKATFFMLGEAVEYNPQIAKRVASESHEIANHTYYHRNLFKWNNRQSILLQEVEKTEKIINKVTGRNSKFFRCPYNYFDKEVVKLLNDKGYIYVGWTFSLRDWERPSPEVMASIFRKNLIPGSIVLLHDGGGDRTNTVKVLPRVIEEAQKKGYRFVTLGELLK